MKKLLIMIALGTGAWYWHSGELPFTSTAGAYDEAGNPVVWIFTIDRCGKPCEMGRNNLKNRRVKYQEKRIDPNDDSDPNVALWKSVGAGGFPLIVAGGERIVGSGSQPMIMTLLGKNFGEKHLSRYERRIFKNHFYADGSPKIVMYGTDWCQFCKKLRGEFAADDIDFIEIDVERVGDMQRLLKTMEITGYPATWVGYTRVNGSNLRAVNRVLKNYQS